MAERYRNKAVATHISMLLSQTQLLQDQRLFYECELAKLQAASPSCFGTRDGAAARQHSSGNLGQQLLDGLLLQQLADGLGARSQV